MPPASTYIRQVTESKSHLVMNCEVKRECDVDWELPADSDSCRIKMLAEYEARTGKSRQKRPLSRVPLWYFLHEVLHVEKFSSLITWEDKGNLVFTIRKPKEIANLWGQIKKRETMTYAKLARGIRYYYGKSVIEKACGKRFSYRFIVSNKTKAVLVGRGCADIFTEGEPSSAKARCYARSRLADSDSCETPETDRRPADGAHVPTKAASCRDRSSSTDSNDMVSSCMSSGDSTSGEDESISELDLFDYDRLLREVLMGTDDDMNRGNPDGRSNSKSSPESDLLVDDVEMSESKVDASAIFKSEIHVAGLSDASSSMVGGRRSLNILKQNASSVAPGNKDLSGGQEKSSFSLAARTSCRSRPGHEVATTDVTAFQSTGVHLSAANGLVETTVSPHVVMSPDRLLSGPISSSSVEYFAGAGALRQASLDLNEAITTGFLQMTRNELAQEYDPLLFDDIFADNVL